jgi:indolepyruvate decarboxylase
MNARKRIMATDCTVSRYLLDRLHALGVRHLFGIPGDFILPFFEVLVTHPIEHIATCNELNAGYAADGYSRLKGLGAAAVTYGPGAFSLVNAVAGAYAERVPLVVISGGPRLAAYGADPQPLLHHVLPGRLGSSLTLFNEITVLAQRLDDPATAPDLIDRALQTCLRERRPVYLEIPCDLQRSPCAAPRAALDRMAPALDPQTLERAVGRVATRMKTGRGVLLAGHEVHRARLQERVRELVEKTGLPIASLFTGKADYAEQWPQCIGLYMGAGSCEPVRQFVESCDTVLFLGAVPSDFNLGGGTARIAPGAQVTAFDDAVIVGNERLAPVPLDAFVDALLAELPAGCGRRADAPRAGFLHRAADPYRAQPDAAITNKRFYDRLAHFLREGDIVLADAGAAVNSVHVQLPAGVQYQTSTYWASIGMGFAASVGACFAAGPQQRVIAVEGDGSFQMTAQELATMTRFGRTPVVFVINNRGYTAERLIHDGPFNDIADWKYHRLCEAWGGSGMEVRTEADLEAALARADVWQGPGPLLIEVHLDAWDASEAFRLMSEALRTR